MLFVLTTGISIAYYVAFKSYSTSLNKLDSLKKMLKNPNARVAAGKTGKSILQRIKAEQTTTEAPKKIHASKNANATVTMLKELIEARKIQQETSDIEYSAPLLDVEVPVQKFEAPKVDVVSMEQIKKALADRMIANQIAQAQVQAQVQQPIYSMPPAGAMPVMQYPVMAPTPMPSFQIAPPAPIAAPVDFTKEELVKMLLKKLDA